MHFQRSNIGLFFLLCSAIGHYCRSLIDPSQCISAGHSQHFRTYQWLPHVWAKDDRDLLDGIFYHLESCILLISALRRDTEDGSCSPRLACKLGDYARDSIENQDMILGAVQSVIGDKFGNFSRSFEGAITQKDRSSCSTVCSRYLSI